MRDVNRIDPFLKTLGDLWKRVPDWRFGQFICNTFGGFMTDPFFIEDDKMLKALCEYFEPDEVTEDKDGN